MPSVLSNLEPKRVLPLGASPGRLSPARHSGLPAFACFVVALAICLAQNFLTPQSKTVFLFDAADYFDSGRQIYQLVRDTASGDVTGYQCVQVAKRLLLDGPGFPGFFAGICLLINRVPQAADWRLCVIVLSALQALSASLLCLLVHRLTGSRLASLAGGLLWGLYPAAVTATGRFLTETFSAVTMLAQVCLLSTIVTGRSPQVLRGGILGLMAGAASGVQLMTKPILAPAVALCDFLALLLVADKRQRIAGCLALCAGCLMVLVPWWMFTYLSLGRATPFPSRDPVLNIATGCDIETDGWGTLPRSPMVSLFAETDGAAGIALGAFATHPAESLSMLARKIGRIWAYPWNDLRYPVLGMSPAGQSWYHSLLMLLGISGLLFLCCGLGTMLRNDRGRAFIAGACITVVIAHLLYSAFCANARYGFVSMPFLVIAAACLIHGVSARQLSGKATLAGLVAVTAIYVVLRCDLIPLCSVFSEHLQTTAWTAAALKLAIFGSAVLVLLCLSRRQAAFPMLPCLLLISGFLIGAVAIAGDACRNAQAHEWSAVIAPGQAAYRHVSLSLKRMPVSALLLVDAGAAIERARFRVNGKTLPGKATSIYQFHPQRYDIINLLQLFAERFSMSSSDLRQWRAIALPLSSINLRGANEIAVEPPPDESVTVYGDTLTPFARRRFLPHWNYISLTKLLNAPFETESRLTDCIGWPAAPSRCRLTGDGVPRLEDLSPAFGKQIGDYRMFIALLYPSGTSFAGERGARERRQAANEAIGAAHYQFRLKAADFSPALVEKDGQVLMAGGSYSAAIHLPQDLKRHSHVCVRVCGSVRSPCAGSKVRIAGMFQDASVTVRQPFSRDPITLSSSAAPTAFEMRDELPLDAVPGGADQIALQFGMRKGVALLKDVLVDIVPMDRPVFKGHRLEIF